MIEFFINSSVFRNDLIFNFGYTPGTDFNFRNVSYVPDAVYEYVGELIDLRASFNETLSDAGGYFSDNYRYTINLNSVFRNDLIFEFYNNLPELQASFDEALSDAGGYYQGNYYTIGNPDGIIDEALSDAGGYYQGNQITGSVIAETLSDAVGFFTDVHVTNIVETLSDAIGGIIGNYDPNVRRYTIRKVCDVKHGGTAVTAGYELTNQDASVIPHSEKQIPSQNASTVKPVITDISNQDATKLDNLYIYDITADAAKTNVRCKQVVNQNASRLNKYKRCSNVQEATKLNDGVVEFDFQQATVTNPDELESKIEVTYEKITESIKTVINGSGYIPNDNFTLTGGYVVSNNPIFEFNYQNVERYIIQTNKGIIGVEINDDSDDTFSVKTKRCSVIEQSRRPPPGVSPWIDLPRPDPDPTPPSGTTYNVPVNEVYTMQNIINVTLSDDSTVIHVDSIELNIDADTYAWNFRAELLDDSQRSLVKPLPDGTPVELHITINGYQWFVIVEKIVTKRVFEGSKITISGRSLSGLLSKPYQSETSMNQGSILGIEQIVDLILPVDWTMNWQNVTWNIPAGAYSHVNKTPIDAVMDISRNIGGVIVPDRTTKILTFRPRYPVLPWNYSLVNVDVAFTADSILALSEEPSSTYNANGVYIHGGEIGGLLGFVRLNGTAGDRLATTRSNDLMTDVIGIRAFGERILAGEYEQPTIRSITTFMDGTTVPLVNIGDFIGITIDGNEIRGICNSVNISANTREVLQQITIGEETTNSWVAFNDILPKNPTLVGTLVETDGITSLMSLVDGGAVRVRGTGTVNSNYYIRSGEIVMDAPNLPLNEIVL